MYLHGYLNKIKKKNCSWLDGSQVVLPDWMVQQAGLHHEQGLRLDSAISWGHRLCLNLGRAAGWPLLLGWAVGWAPQPRGTTG